MSGLIGHTMYGILARREARARGLSIATLLARHDASYLCGAYLGCDIQTMPEAVCGKQKGGIFSPKAMRTSLPAAPTAPGRGNAAVRHRRRRMEKRMGRC